MICLQAMMTMMICLQATMTIMIGLELFRLTVSQSTCNGMHQVPLHLTPFAIILKIFTTTYSLEDIAIFDDDYTRMVIQEFLNGKKLFG